MAHEERIAEIVNASQRALLAIGDLPQFTNSDNGINLVVFNVLCIVCILYIIIIMYGVLENVP